MPAIFLSFSPLFLKKGKRQIRGWPDWIYPFSRMFAFEMFAAERVSREWNGAGGIPNLLSNARQKAARFSLNALMFREGDWEIEDVLALRCV